MRAALRWVLALAAMVTLVSCGRSDAGERTLVLYVSADDALLRPVAAEFEKQKGIRLATVGDTEATKTFGLVRRLMDEQPKPRADAFWASEPLGMIRLGKAGVLRPIEGDRMWLPLAYRARVIAYHTGRLTASVAPKDLRDLLDPSLKGKVGLARPQFGTTRTHMAVLLTMFGEERYVQFVRALRANGARIYDGNSMVVQAVAQGEISAGLTDSDDVEAGKADHWPVDWNGGTAAWDAPAADRATTILMPHVVGLVRRSDETRSDMQDTLVKFLRSDTVQKQFVGSGAALCGWSDVGAVQVRGGALVPDYDAAARNELRAVELFEKTWAE